MFTPSLMLLSKSSSTTPPEPDFNRRKQREQRIPSPFPLFAPVEFLLRVFISLLPEELAGHGFTAASHAVAMGAAVRAAGLVHFRNHAGFQRGERNFVRALSYSTMSFHHSSAVSFLFMSRFAAGMSGSGLAVAVGF